MSTDEPPVERLLDRLPPILPPGPAFWRRSVQARVVASTVLLSAAGRRDRRRLPDPADPRRARRQPGRRRWSRRPRTRRSTPATQLAPPRASRWTSPAAAGRWSSRSSAAGLDRGFAVILSPADRRRRPALRRWCEVHRRASTCASVPEHAPGSASTSRLADGLDLHRHPDHPSDIPGLPEGPGIVVGSQVRCRRTTAPTRSTTSTRSTRSSEHARARSAAPC